MKRKLNKKQHKSFVDEKLEIDKAVARTRPSSSCLKLDKHTEISGKACVLQSENKRIRCDTPPPEPEKLDLPSSSQTSRQNRHLLEAIQLKMLELQNELDAFEHEVEVHEQDFYYQNDNRNNRANNQMSKEDAEALGFAMCAQETMLFLQSEGISSNSPLYSRLRDALVGRSQTKRIVHI